MTEEIIIDGVDVLGCEYMLNNKIQGKQQCPAKPMYYAKETSCIACKEHNTKLNFCKNNPNCYYKQLKRLEQENKELKEMLSKEPKAMQAFQISYSGLKRDNKVLWGMVKDYKTTLEEIREITNYAEQKLHCCCDITKMLVNIETKTNEVLND